MSITVQDVLKKSTFRTIDVEQVLDPNGSAWINFDPELGYVPTDCVLKDGMDISSSTYRHEPTGQRKMVNYPDRPCRVNTYGDSYTQCQQVSDGETWQEVLGAHFGEPIRNFGCGGQSVFVAYRKALRMEATECSAKNVILGIWDDDHLRNLDAARWLRTAWNSRPAPENVPQQIHGLPWAHLRYDLDSDGFVEMPGACETGDDLLKLCDPDVFYNTYKDDHIVHLYTLQLGGEAGEATVRHLELIAEALGIKGDLRDPAKRVVDAARLHDFYGVASNYYILEKAFPWAKENNKNLMLLLSYMPHRAGEDIIDKGVRNDQAFVDYLDENKLPYIDTLIKQADHVRQHSIPFSEYRKKYYVGATAAAVFGHFNAPGNHLFAYMIKDEMLEWLDPKPQAYL